MWICINCGEKINDDEKICPCCGEECQQKMDVKPKPSICEKVQKRDEKDRVIEAILKLKADFNENISSGTGFVIEGDYIVTNAHVVTHSTKNRQVVEAKNILASFDKDIRKDVFQLQLVDYNVGEDVAILKAVKFNDYTYRLKLGDSSKVKRADKVFTIGCPLDFDFSYLEGVISSPSRKDSTFNEVIQTNLPINHGNSGGPLCNEQCEVIGITTFSRTTLDLDTEILNGDSKEPLPLIRTIEGMSFCVTSEAIKQLLNKVNMRRKENVF